MYDEFSNLSEYLDSKCVGRLSSHWQNRYIYPQQSINIEDEFRRVPQSEVPTSETDF